MLVRLKGAVLMNHGQISLRQRCLIQSQAIVEGHASSVSVHHLQGFPTAKVFDGHGINPCFPQETGKGSPKGVRIAWEASSLAQYLEHVLNPAWF